MNEDSNLSQTVCVYLYKENSQGTMTRTTRKGDYKTNKLSCGSIHSVHESLDVFVSFFMLQFIAQVVVLVALFFMSQIHLSSMHQIYSLSDLYGNSLKRFTLRKWSCEVLSLQIGSQSEQISRRPRFCSHAFMFSSSSLFFLHLPLRHGKRVVPLIAWMDARKTQT